MKKLLLILILPLLLVFLIFHDKGNTLIKPYLSIYLEKQLKENNITLKIETLHIDYGHIKATAIINQITQINIDGHCSIFDKYLNINYKLLSKGFKSKNISFKGNIDIKGRAKGQFDNIDVDGEGRAFTSDVVYTFNLKKRKVHALKVDMDRANIEELLVVMALPAYATGTTDIHLTIPLLDGNISTGEVNINLYQALLNEQLLSKEFDITIPPHTKLTAKVHSKFSNDVLLLNGYIESNLANLSFKNAHYHLQQKELKSDYDLKIKELKYLQPVIKQKLYGSLALKGVMEYKDKNLTLESESKSLGGLVQILLKENQFFANFKNIHLEKFLYLLGKKPYGRGVFTANVEIDNLTTMQGRFKLNSKNIQTINSTIKQEFDIDLQEPLNINIKSKGKIISNTLYSKNELLTDIMSIHSNNLEYHLRNNHFKGDYTLSIPKLHRLKPFIQRPLKGKLECQGEIKKDKTLLLTGKTNNLGGIIDFTLKNDNLSVDINNTSVLKLMQMIQYPQTFNAKIFGDIQYNLTDKQGTIHTQLKQAQLLPNEITRMVKEGRGIDLTKERYNHSTFIAQIHNKEVDFNFTAKSKTTSLSLNDAHLNLNKETIHTDCTLIIDNKDVSGTIKGNIHNPELKVNSSNFIKNEIMNVVSEQLDDKTLEEFGIGKKEKAMIKNLFDSFF